jgi:hypothetical protein
MYQGIPLQNFNLTTLHLAINKKVNGDPISWFLNVTLKISLDASKLWDICLMLRNGYLLKDLLSLKTGGQFSDNNLTGDQYQSEVGQEDFGRPSR